MSGVKPRYMVHQCQIMHFQATPVNCVDEPTCGASVTTVQPGGDIVLTCRMAFSGVVQPVMTWFAGDGEQLASEDGSEPGLIQHQITRSVTIDDDRRPFRCVTRLDDEDLVCTVVVHVPRQ